MNVSKWPGRDRWDSEVRCTHPFDPLLPAVSGRYRATQSGIGLLTLGLLVIVRPEAGNPTESPSIHQRWFTTGRLPVDVDVDPAVDLAHPRCRILPRTGWCLASGRLSRGSLRFSLSGHRSAAGARLRICRGPLSGGRPWANPSPMRGQTALDRTMPWAARMLSTNASPGKQHS